MKYVSLAIAAIAIAAVFRFLTLAPPIDPCNPPHPQPDAICAAPVPGAPSPTLAPAPPPQYDTPAHVLFVTVEADLRGDRLEEGN